MGQRKSKIHNIHIQPSMDAGPRVPMEKDSETADNVDDEQKQEKDFKGLLKDFAEQTTMHGLSRVVSPDRHVILRLLWFALVIAVGGEA